MGTTWDQEMPAVAGTDRDIAAILTYIRREWGHTGGPVKVSTVETVRAACGERQHAWTVSELRGELESREQ